MIKKYNYISKVAETTTPSGFGIELWDFSRANSCLDARVEAVTWAASTCYGQETSKNPQELYDKLMVEGAMGTPTRPFEFVPVIKEVEWLMCTNDESEKTKYYIVSHLINKRRDIKKPIDKNEKGLRLDNDINHYLGFLVFRLTIPSFIRSHLKTHTRISSIVQSNRIGKERNETTDYWMPEQIKNEDLYNMLHRYTLDDSKKLMKKREIRPEVACRFPNGWKKEKMVLAGWIQDPSVWKNLFLERGGLPGVWKNWVQKETAEVVRGMTDMVKIEMNELFEKYITIK